MTAARMAWQALSKPVMNGLSGLFKNQKGTDLLFRFGPDAAYAALSGTLWAPDNATMGERFALAGEDLALGLGSSVTGQLIGRRIGRGRAKAGLDKARADGLNTPVERQQAKNTAQQTVDAWTTGGDVLAQLGLAAVPRTITQGVYQAAGERAMQSQPEIQANIDTAIAEEQLAQALTALAEGGYLTGTMQAPATVTSARNLTGMA